jgi:putative membrane protein
MLWLPLVAAGLYIGVPSPTGERQEKQVQVKKETTAAPQDNGVEKVTPQQFLTQAIDCSLSETDMAQKAASGASTDRVRQFAQKLVDDHNKLTQRLMGAAKDLKLGVVTGMSPEHKKALARMLLSKGNEFDREFLSYIVKSHEKALKLFEQCAKATDGDANVHKLAEDSVPTLRQHLQDARTLQTQMFGKEEKR